MLLLFNSCNTNFQNNEIVILSRTDWDALEFSKTYGMYQYTEPLENVLTRIVMHHSAFSDQPGPRFLQEYQIYKMGFDDIAYHYIIGEDGEIYEGRLINYMGAHAGQTKEANTLAGKITMELVDRPLLEAVKLDPDFGSIGICLDGNFDLDEPGEAQLESLLRLIKYLQEKYDIRGDNILLHNEVTEKIIKKAGLTPVGEETVCPGRFGSTLVVEYLLKNSDRSLTHP